MNYYYAAAGAYMVYVMTAYGTAKLMNLTGENFYIFFGLLTVLGLLACGAFIWFKNKYSKPKGDAAAAASGDSGGGGGDEVDVLIREAETRLGASKLAQGANIGNLPLLFIIGESGSAKTTAVVRSGIEPELLAGQVFQDNNVAPTRSANIWFARNMIFAEAGARMMTDSAAWVKMVKRLKPGALKSVVGGSTQAPRGVVLCFDSEVFTRPNAADHLTAAARNLQARLGDVSQSLGISLPVYVLFTRADRLPFYADYMRTLSNEEAQQVLGVTLPMRPKNSTGVYAEEETKRVNWAFTGIFHSLCDKRNEFLGRENDPDKLPGAYEFPREFRKIRSSLVQFLVDVCRPSQLTASPFLRGFYFSGVRPIIVNDDMVPQPQRQPDRAAFVPSESATGIFHIPQAQTFAAPEMPQFSGSKKVPQWMFLPHLFHHVILKDAAAMGASGSSVKTSKLQRVLLGVGAVLCLLLSIAFTVSYFKNRALENTALDAAKQLSESPSPGAGTPSKVDLERLDTLRTTLETIKDYRQNGVPFMMRWFLYSGESMYPNVRQAYYNNFGKLLFFQTQAGWRNTLEKLPNVPAATDPYRPIYDTLKAYLITTSNHEKSTREFLSPFLFKSWSTGKEVEPLKDLANKQFDFYSDDLRDGNPYPPPSSMMAVNQGRIYLWGFAGAKRVYQEMLNDVGSRYKTVSFPKQFPEATTVVNDTYEVSGAFTKDGYAFMMDAIKNARKYFQVDWVLAECPVDKVSNCGAATVPMPVLQQQLTDDYTADFIAQWRNYLKNGRVLPYASLEDAADKLDKQRSNRPPLMQLLWLAGQNTAVDSKKIKEAFDSVQQVTPASLGNTYAGDANRPYLGAIGELQLSISDVAKLPGTPDPATVQATRSKAGVAINTVKQIAGRFAPDTEAKMDTVVQRLLEAPITFADGMLGRVGEAQKAAQGKALCDQFRGVAAKFPFNPKAQVEVSLEELATLYKPGSGALWTFYESTPNLKIALPKPAYAENSAAGMALNPQFVTFFKNAATFSEAIYRDGPDPKIPYRVTPLKSDPIDDLAMTLDGNEIKAPPGGGATRLLTWIGSGTHGASISAKGVPPSTYQGLWAPFRLFSLAQKSEPAGSGYNLEWYLQLGFAGKTATSNAARFNFDMSPIPI
ncbi:MAG: ImcF-related family protein, partial [Bryobacteraceae bacterium]